MWPFKKKEIIYSKRKYINYLPVGTIVKLYNDENEYMIFRYLGNACVSYKASSKALQKSRLYSNNKEDKNKYYRVDYEVVPYPTGVLIEENCIMHEDIEEVIHLGYDDEFRQNILRDIDTWNEKGESYE